MDYSPPELKKAFDVFERLQEKEKIPKHLREQMATLLRFIRSRIEPSEEEGLSRELIRVTSPNVQHILETAGIRTLQELCALDTEELFEELYRKKQAYNSVLNALDAHDIPHNSRRIDENS